ncbi:MAG: AAA family ATPase [Patescibacteria group bacterium UBA2163]
MSGMHLAKLEVSGFKSFAKKTSFDFSNSIVAIVGPNGSGKSNVAEAIRFVLGEQSMKSMRGKRGEDLIWNGSNTIGRANRASVALTFDNTSRFLDIDFDEVLVERVVNRDGSNEYRINGATVRLKDVFNVLANANIGQSSHHIISQGEADKILSASPKERREMLEDSLGLKVYQYKKEESTRKLEKTQENIRQVEALRREVQPHLRFLKRQVDKIKKTEDLRRDAVDKFRVYFMREDAYIRVEKARLTDAKKEKQAALEAVRLQVQEARAVIASNTDNIQSQKIVSLSEEIDTVRASKSVAAQEAARLSGQLEALRSTTQEASVSSSALSEMVDTHEQSLEEHTASVDTLRVFVQNVFTQLRSLITHDASATESIDKLAAEKETYEVKARSLTEQEAALTHELDALRKELDEARTEERQKERELFTLSAKERDIAHEVQTLNDRLSRLALEEEELKRELGEVGVLVGSQAVTYEVDTSLATSVSRTEQEEEKRALQKVKVRIEEAGAGGGDDVLKEYEEVSERERFLETEIKDLEESAASLQQLIADLDTELSTRFEKGIMSINAEFSRFFGLMFDGGSAKLVFTKETPRKARAIASDEFNQDNKDDNEEEQSVAGVDLALSVPQKRIKSLVMLSGGERALTSIALIFAMSSVNPPPFLVLDETDAALDEANSRRYGDMVSALSEKSQLLLITHNRETMSRAGILYGVTMGGDGVSKVLSVKLEEAVSVAK